MYEEISTSDAESYYNHEQEISKVTLQQVKDLAQNLIKSHSTAAIVPK
jgi:predicted Zn-dependent peptidase